MAYWLLKSEPFKYSWDQLVKDKRTHWDGVRNYAARNNLRAMKKGDLAFFYHSNEGVEIVGIVKICKEHYQDPTTAETAWVVVDVSPVKKLKRTIPLSEIKTEKKLQNMALLKQSRLSVQPVTAEEWEIILQLADH
jgi:predicted RNA-binding protein with PUA-like domain